MSLFVLWIFLAPLLLSPTARQVPDEVVFEHDDALQRETLAFETKLLNVSSLHSTVEVRQAASAAAEIARFQQQPRRGRMTSVNAASSASVSQRSRRVAAKNLGLIKDNIAYKDSSKADQIPLKSRQSSSAQSSFEKSFDLPSSSSSSSSASSPSMKASTTDSSDSSSYSSSHIPSQGFMPGDSAPPFRLFTTKGVLHYPDDLFFRNVSVLFLTFNNQSGFSSVSWTNPASLRDFVTSAPEDARFVYFSAASEPAVAAADVLWMRAQLQRAVDGLRKSAPFAHEKRLKEFVKDRCVFVVTPLTQLGNWIPAIQQQVEGCPTG